RDDAAVEHGHSRPRRRVAAIAVCCSLVGVNRADVPLQRAARFDVGRQRVGARVNRAFVRVPLDFRILRDALHVRVGGDRRGEPSVGRRGGHHADIVELTDDGAAAGGESGDGCRRRGVLPPGDDQIVFAWVLSTNARADDGGSTQTHSCREQNCCTTHRGRLLYWNWRKYHTRVLI